MTSHLLVHVFTRAEQNAFARLSGDGNAIHLDPRRARRELFGRNILHGLHGALRAIEAFLTQADAPEPGSIHLTRVRARFNAPVFLGEKIHVVVVKREPQSAQLELRNREQTLYDIEIAWAAGSPNADGSMLPSPAPTSAPHDRTLEELAGRSAELPLGIDAPEFRLAFPRVAASTSVAQQAGCLGVTRLVGLESPGQQSLLSLFDLTPSPSAPADRLFYEVETADPRFSLVKMRVSGGRLEGRVEAFYRPLPVDQAPFEAARAHTGDDAFRGVRALVVGGSRGLGEVAAKLLAAGGADVLVTYRVLGEEAERVVRDICAGGGRATAIRWNALRPERSAAALERLGGPTHLLYFATPRMTPRRQPHFSGSALRSMSALYVDGLVRTCRACRALTDSQLTLFFPSVRWVDQPARGTAESAAAKAAGEAACRSLAAVDRKLRVVIQRFPRLNTDQAQSLTPSPADDPLPVLATALRELMG